MDLRKEWDEKRTKSNFIILPIVKSKFVYTVYVLNSP
jgi:hypothetical protein